MQASTSTADLRETLANLGLESPSSNLIVEHQRSLSKGQHLYRRGDRTDEIYVVLEGALKAYFLTAEGEEEVLGFHFPAEAFGIDSFSSEERIASVIALQPSVVSPISISVLARCMQEDRDLRSRWYRLLSRMIREEQQFTGILRRSNAEQRVASFLLQIRDHQCPDEKYPGGEPCRINMPMTRSDTANYLGLSVETVSRVVSRLRRKRAIRLIGRQLELSDLYRLRLMANVFHQRECASRDHG